VKNSDSIVELPDTNDRKYIKIGVSILLFVFGILGVWSSYAKMDTGVPLSGQVVVESNNKIIQHLEGGIVEKIYVKDGDFVKKGDRLIKFSDIRAKSSLQSLEVKYYEAIALYDRLTAENSQKEKIEFSKELDALDESRREHLIQAQLEIFNNRKSSFEKEKKIASQKIASFNEQIDNLKETIKTKESLLVSYQDELKEQQELYDERLIDKVKLRELKRKVKSIQSDILSNKTEITKTRIEISSIKTQLSLSQEDFFRKVKNQLRDTQISIGEMKAKMTELRDRLSRITLKAPVSGIILNMAIHTIGAVVSPGKPIMEIVTKDSKLIIKARLSPEYIDYVKIGLKANMTFPAFQLKGRFINNIEGEVIFVSADSTTDQKGNSFYGIKLIVDKEGMETLKEENLELLAGMPASVIIKIGKQTTLEYLLKPMTIMLQRAFLEE